jgi:hypothetical protein
MIVTVNVIPRTLTLFTLMTEKIRSSETSVLTRTTRSSHPKRPYSSKSRVFSVLSFRIVQELNSYWQDIAKLSARLFVSEIWRVGKFPFWSAYNLHCLKVKLFPQLTYQSPRHEDESGSGIIAPPFVVTLGGLGGLGGHLNVPAPTSPPPQIG